MKKIDKKYVTLSPSLSLSNNITFLRFEYVFKAATVISSRPETGITNSKREPINYIATHLALIICQGQCVSAPLSLSMCVCMCVWVCIDQCNRDINSNRNSNCNCNSNDKRQSEHRKASSEQFLMCTFCSVAIANVTVATKKKRKRRREQAHGWGTGGGWAKGFGAGQARPGRAGPSDYCLPKCQMPGHIS